MFRIALPVLVAIVLVVLAGLDVGFAMASRDLPAQTETLQRTIGDINPRTLRGEDFAPLTPGQSISDPSLVRFRAEEHMQGSLSTNPFGGVNPRAYRGED